MIVRERFLLIDIALWIRERLDAGYTFEGF